MGDATAAIQSALAPHGPEAAGIAEIAWLLFGGGAALFALVIALAAYAVIRPRRWLARPELVVAGGIALPVVVLSALLLYTLYVSPRPTAGPVELRIEVVGHQWWWEVHYLDEDGAIGFSTANEIRLPVDRVVEARLRSADVLHSFWVPALAGKLDLIPGRDNYLRFAASRAGIFRGQCAEYCGGPHAQMALLVVAQHDDEFHRWRAAQHAPRQTDDSHGEALFLAHCGNCHTVRGTEAAGRLGPDLTHFASRLSLGAGILPNTAGTVAGWIAGSQHLKPGNLMPEFRGFDGAELRALATYLTSLD
jgi:cytochrome c oxidase subunit 2